MSIKGAMIAASVAGLFAMGASGVASAKSGEEVMCDGVNACKGTGACKSKANACKGQNSCKGAGFTMQKDEAACKAAQAAAKAK